MSLLDWIDSLPRGWEAKPLRSTVDYVVSNVDKVPSDDEIPVRLCNYTDVYNNEFITLALEFMQATATKDEIAKFGLRVDDVAITKDSESWDDIGVPALVRETANDLVCGYHLALLRPHRQQMDGAFLFRCLQAKPVRIQLELAANGVTRFGIPKSEIGAMTLPVPPLVQQRTIADYLDRETARMDALVAAKERVLGLLAEKRRALITRAVTRGLDPRAPLRDSGIPWLGEIPAHWETSKFTWSVFIIEGQVDPEIEPYVSMPLIAPNHVESGTGRLLSTETAGDQGAISGKYLCRRGDVIYSKIRPALRKATMAVEDCLCSADMYPLRSREGMGPEFLLLFLLSEPFSTWAVLESNRVAMPKINREALSDIRIPVPPPKEQREIVKRIAQETAKLDKVRAATERTISLLTERRAALIAAAVTGQIEVESAA